MIERQRAEPSRSLAHIDYFLPLPRFLSSLCKIISSQRLRYIALLWNRAVKVRDAIKLIESDGWYLARTRGSHRQFKHPEKPGLVTIAGNANVDLPRGTLNSIFKQAGLKI